MIREKKVTNASTKEAPISKSNTVKGKAQTQSPLRTDTAGSKIQAVVGADESVRSEEAVGAPAQSKLLPGFVCVPTSDLPELMPLADSCDLSLVTIESIWNGKSVGFGSHGPTLDAIPARLIGFVSASLEGAAQIESLRTAWAQQLKSAAPEALAAKNPIDFESIYLWLVRRLVHMQTDMAVRNTALMRSLFVVRAEHEAVQESFQRLESYAYATSLATRQIALSLEPKKNELIKTGALAAAEIRQLVPVSSLGLCDLAIHVLQVPSAPGGKLEITLQTLEDGNNVGTWSIPAAKIRLGWLRLGLEQALSADERSVVAFVRWSGAGEITLSLSDPHPEPRWCALQGKKNASGPLSMKVWRSFPGTRAVPAVHSRMNASVESRVQMLYADDLRKVESAGHSQEGISFDEGGNSVLVHPVVGGVTWARLSQVVSVGTAHIFADVETKNDTAGPVEYAIAVAASADKSRKATSLQFKPGSISEWVRVDAATQSQVHLHLDPAVQADHDLYLGTRLKPGDSNAYCWAHFKKIRLSR